MTAHLIYHIITRSGWEQALAAGRYAPPSLAAEGFIHCSRAHQVAAVANALYRDVPDLLLLCIDSGRLLHPLRDEPPAHPAGAQAPLPDGMQLFPHLYGPLNPDAVIEVRELRPGPDGLYSNPT